MKRKAFRPRRTGAIALVIVGLVIGVAMMATPAIGHVGGTVSHLWSQHIKPKADARYLQNTIVVTETSGSITPGNFGTARADCPAGWKAIGGGLDLDNVLTMVVTASTPIVNDQSIIFLADGQHPAATGWQGHARNNGAGNAGFKVAVICSK